MTAAQENKLSMYLAGQAVCDRHQPVWQGLPAFSAAFAEFTAHLAALQGLATGRGRRRTGVAEDKRRLRAEMADAAFEVAAATRACAKAARNGDLAARVDFSRSELLASRDTESATRCDAIHAAATGALAALADYGITAAALAALQARIAAYRGVLTKPREALATGKTATARLAAEFRATDALLADRLDNLAPQFRTAGRVFAADYRNARRIVPAAASREPGKPAAPAPAA